MTATPAFGGIELAWTYSEINPQAVSKVRIYRAYTNNFSASVRIADWTGDRYFDQTEAGAPLQVKYYWIQMLSVNGTWGSLIGPASATAKPRIAEMLELLTAQIDAGVLAQSLKTEIQKITDLSYAVDSEIADRLLGDNTLQQAVQALEGEAGEIRTLIVDEITQRTQGQQVIMESLEQLGTGSGSNYALLEERVDLLADDVSAMGVDVETLITHANDYVAAVQTVAQAVTTLEGSMTSLVNQAESNAANSLAQVKTELETDIGLVDGKVTDIGARWTAQVNVNGLIGGFGVYNNGAFVEAGFDVDTFWVGRTTNKVKPFIIKDGTVYISKAVIEKITADMIDTRGLQLRDADGQVYLSSVNPLPTSLVTPAAGWLNSNVTLSNDGTLNNAGGGQVTIRGIGYTGDLNATAGAPAGTYVGSAEAASLVTQSNTAYNNAQAAQATLATMRSNGYLDAAEKPAVIKEWVGISNAHTALVSQAAALGVTTEKDAYVSAKNALQTYLSGLFPAWDNTTVDTPITPATDQVMWTDLYATRQVLLAKMTQLASTTAQWSGVSGSNKPQDNATVGATWNSNVSGQPADGNIYNNQIGINNSGEFYNTSIGQSGIPVSNNQLSIDQYGRIFTGTTQLSGQVTLSGLGFTGATDATYGLAASRQVLAGSAGLATGTLTWDTNGARVSGYGVALTAKGITAYNSSGEATFTLNGDTGNAFFKGVLAANTVVTDNLVDNSINLPTNAYTVTDIDCPANTDTTIQTLSWTSTGKPVFISVSVNVEWPGTTTSCQFTLRTASGTFWSGFFASSNRIGQAIVSFSTTLMAPTAGPVVLDLRARPSQLTTVSRINVFALEMKK